MSRLQSRIVTAVGVLALLAMLVCATLAATNRGLQQQVGQRQQYVQQSVQLETLYNGIVRSLAELGSRSNDPDLTAMLQRNGISYTDRKSVV